MAEHTLPLRTERLLLRPFVDDDLEAFHGMFGRAEVARYLYWEPRTLDESREALERVKAMTSFEAEAPGIRLAAVLPESGTVVGDVSLRRVSEVHRQGEVGYVIHPDHQGLGYATEATAALIDVGFRDIGLHRIRASADARNVASIRVMEHLGMRREALFVESEFVKGEWTDEVVCAILATEWQRARPA